MKLYTFILSLFNRFTASKKETSSAVLVSDENRLQFLPSFFGARYMLRGEHLVYVWMGRLCEDYNGAYWHFYETDCGARYMTPDIEAPVRIDVHGNGFEGDMSADAAGIVATLFALGQLAQETKEDYLIDFYHLLRNFAYEHPESSAIFRAID